MAGIALRRSGDVIGRFSQSVYRDITAAMASGAIARCERPGSAGMAHGSWCKCRGVAMAGIALRGGWDVGARLAGGGDTMATGAATSHGRGDRIVVEHRTRKSGGTAMAGIALRGGGNMVRRFSQSVYRDITTAMASGAIARSQWPSSAGMAHGSRRKGRGVAMAGIALRGGWDMRARLAGGGDTMATGAATSHGRGDRIVIEHRTRKSGGAAMAGIALRGGGNMVRRFSQSVYRDITTAMASGAIARSQWPSSAGMAHGSRRKGRGVSMAGIALRGGWDMRARLAGGGDAMAGGAATGHRRGDRIVVEHRTRKSGGAAMAGIALRGGGNMVGRFSQSVYRDITTAMASGAIARSQWPGSAGMAHGSRHKIRGVAYGRYRTARWLGCAWLDLALTPAVTPWQVSQRPATGGLAVA